MSNKEAIKEIEQLINKGIVLKTTTINLPRKIVEALEKAIKALSEPPRPKGRWIKDIGIRIDVHTGERWEEIYYNCSKCDYASDWLSSFCPNCGADMR